MLQKDFLKTLLIKCREAGIHTAVDTAGNVPWEYFEEILPYTDMFLYDVKCISEKLHLEGTGVSNKRILDNLKQLSEIFKGDIIIRIPVIPGFNMDKQEIQKNAEYLRDIRYKKIEPLPYHKLGENKYEAIGERAVLYEVPSGEDMEWVKAVLNTGFTEGMEHIKDFLKQAYSDIQEIEKNL